jgi:mono/diheme cytochrome c family protein
MKDSKRFYNPIFGKLLAAFISIFFTISAYGQGDPFKGQDLFKTNCAACHKLDQRLIGPPLKGVSSKYDIEWLRKWIRNSAEMIQAGDADAVAIFAEYNNVPMTAFPNLSDQDIDDILAYSDADPASLVKNDVAVDTQEVPVKEADASGSTNFMLLGAIIFIVFLLILLLYKLKITLLALQNKEQSPYSQELTNYLIYLAKNKAVNFAFVAVIALGGVYSFWTWGLGVGVDKGYQPIQPIQFSHKVHAGDQGIDCNYCHSSARVSKHSGIPSANVCMNCHKMIQEGTNTGKEEIAKIYDAIGFDPATNSYIDGYEEKPIEWVRIHNLPDFVYFNHSQHVTVGKLDCQECHGPVEEMEELYQFNDLTMGWCIDCHRTKEVQMEGNEYYEEIHASLAKKYGTEKLTVEMIGGLECGKCHY